jgi:hypothetical protein
VLRESRLALLEVLIQHLIARAPRGAIDELMQVPKIGKFLREGKCAEADALLDRLQVLPCAAQIRLTRGLLERRPIAHALQHEIVLNAAAAPSAHAAGARWSAHVLVSPRITRIHSRS